MRNTRKIEHKVKSNFWLRRCSPQGELRCHSLIYCLATATHLLSDVADRRSARSWNIIKYYLIFKKWLKSNELTVKEISRYVQLNCFQSTIFEFDNRNEMAKWSTTSRPTSFTQIPYTVNIEYANVFMHFTVFAVYFVFPKNPFPFALHTCISDETLVFIRWEGKYFINHHQTWSRQMLLCIFPYDTNAVSKPCHSTGRIAHILRQTALGRLAVTSTTAKMRLIQIKRQKKQTCSHWPQLHFFM